MNPTTKEFIDEILAHRKGKPAGKYLAAAEKKMGLELTLCNSKLLYWLHTAHKKIENTNAGKIGIKRCKFFETYIDNCAALALFCTPYPDHLDWKDGMAAEEKDEIAKYVFDNFKIKLYTSSRPDYK